jgi:hypothetical protein
MKITIATVGWNEETTILSVLRYYLEICKFDRFIYFDNFSDDKTIEKIKSVYAADERVVIYNTPYVGHKPEEEVHLMNNTMLQDSSDIFVWIDSDEILYCKDWLTHLNNLISNKKYYSATLMSNVFNEVNSFDETKENILDNFEYVYTDLVFKIPIIIKNNQHVITFGGGHHTICIDGINVGDNNPDTSFADIGLHLFHFTYINTDMYYRRKTLGRERNLNLGIDNSWYHNYWNLKLSDIQGIIENQKANGKSITEYVN